LRDFRNLKAWEKAHELALAVYKMSTGFPGEERYGLTSQIRRASTSIPTNISEGCGRDTEKDFARFLHIAMGSASETEYLLLLARDLGFVDEAAHNGIHNQAVEVKRMLGGLIRKLKADG
jgi:four helix bundle protein